MGSEKSADQACCLFSKGFDDIAKGEGENKKESLYFTWAWVQFMRWIMGYGGRTQPDLVNAKKYCQAGLTKDPQHRGALEYYGELLLIKNDLAGAENMLVRLDKACFFGCEEYDDLKKIILEYKSRK